ncbi:MAG: hypothetical protein ACXAEN_07390 [Candidatus Thorarchaeota archaeon]|jgi:hypothetical protein
MIEVRPTKLSDIEYQLRLCTLEVGDNISVSLKKGMDAKCRFWGERLSEDEFIGFMATENRKPVGFINVLRASKIPYLFYDIQRHDTLHVENKCLYVPPPLVENDPAKSREIYDTLLSAVVKLAQEHNLHGVSGIAWKDGVYRPDRSTYERNGFKVIHTFSKYNTFIMVNYDVGAFKVRRTEYPSSHATIVTFKVSSCPFSIGIEEIVDEAIQGIDNVEYECVDIWDDPDRAMQLGFPGNGPLTVIDGEILFYARNAKPNELRKRILQNLGGKGLL